jgi:hypothetical protein
MSASHVATDTLAMPPQLPPTERVVPCHTAIEQNRRWGSAKEDGTWEQPWRRVPHKGTIQRVRLAEHALTVVRECTSKLRNEAPDMSSYWPPTVVTMRNGAPSRVDMAVMTYASTLAAPASRRRANVVEESVAIASATRMAPPTVKITCPWPFIRIVGDGQRNCEIGIHDVGSFFFAKCSRSLLYGCDKLLKPEQRF